MTINNDTDWNREDAIAAAEEAVSALRAEVDRLRAKLTDAEAAQAAHGVSARETVESAVAEAKRRGGGRTRSEQISNGDAAATSPAVTSDAAVSAQSASDGRAEAARRAARR